jgi:hypothetical protein
MQLRIKGTADEYLSYLFPVIQANHSVAAVFDVVLLYPEDIEPARVFWQDDLELPGREVDAGYGDRLGPVAHEHVRSQAVVHEVPANKYRARCQREQTKREGAELINQGLEL